MKDHFGASRSTAGVPAGYSPSTQVGNLFENPAAWAPKGIFRARVQRVSIEHGTHIVQCVAQLGGASRPFDAIVTTPYISPEGRGIVTGIRKGTLCLICVSKSEDGATFYAFAFFSPNPKQWDRSDIQSGDIYLINEAGGYLASLANGDIEARATDTLFTTWSAEDGSRESSARTSRSTAYAGDEIWAHWRKAEGDRRGGDTRRSISVRRSVDETNSQVEPTYVEEQGRVLRKVDGADVELITVREVVKPDGTVLFRERVETDGTLTIEHPSGSHIVMKKNGDVFVTPATGKKLRFDDDSSVAQGVSRIGDKTVGHSHTAVGPWGSLGTSTNTDTMAEGSSTVKAGG